jgi:phosphatidylserine decarboxylase
MATLEPRTAPLTPAPITSIQPGGGLGLDIERAWGRLRRAWQRRFRPGYVGRMAALRQGGCDDCPHEVQGPHDLKLYRNVCSYRFPGADLLLRPHPLRLARAGLAEVVCFSLLFFTALVVFVAAAVFVHATFWLPVGVVALLWAFVLSFFRDPERAVPEDPAALVSPADGTVTHVGLVEEPDFPDGLAFRVSIFLSVFNVHVNRVPRTGRVVAVRYFPGRYLDARHRDCAVLNEQLWIDFEDAATGRPVRIKQIAGAIARRIVCWLRPGEEVQAGMRLGMIKFGSRTEVLLPADLAVEVRVKVGDKVQGGRTVLLRLPVRKGGREL